jgi:hypothetical protein
MDHLERRDRFFSQNGRPECLLEGFGNIIVLSGRPPGGHRGCVRTLGEVQNDRCTLRRFQCKEA